MAVLALVLIAVWLLLVAGLPTGIQLRRTGDASAPRFRDRPGSPQWWARLLSGVGFACAVAAPLAELAGLEPIPLLDRTPVRAAGAMLAVLGIAATLAAQLAMGSSWRPDVDPDTRTALVTTGRSGWSATQSSPPRPPPPPVLPSWFPTCLRPPCWSHSLPPFSSRSAWLRSPTCTASTGPPGTGTPPRPAASCPGLGGTAQARGRRRLRPSSRSWLSCAPSYPVDGQPRSCRPRSISQLATSPWRSAAVLAVGWRFREPDCLAAHPSVAIIAKADAEGMTSMAGNATATDASGL